MKLIGITGKAGTGKDTIANYLVRRYRFRRVALADPIKRGLDAIFDFSSDDWDDREWKEAILPAFGVSPRRLAQTLGTEWGRREIADDIWLKLAEIAVDSYRRSRYPHGIVIPDIRFDNEATWIRNQGGQLWHISRPGAGLVEAHSSEDGVAVLPPDRLIRNGGSLEALYSRVDELLLPSAVAA